MKAASVMAKSGGIRRNGAENISGKAASKIAAARQRQRSREKPKNGGSKKSLSR